MQRSGILNRIFHLRAGEASLVRNLFFHHFFLGFGTALLFTVGHALFLAEFTDERSLPWVFLIGGVVLLVTGRIYATLEHRVRLSKLLPALLLFLTASLILFWMGMNFWAGTIAVFMLMLWHRVVYLLGNLEFWGLTALLYDVRQSKRVFGLISSGDIPAKLLGYGLVSFAAKYEAHISLYHLLILGAISFFLAWYMLNRVIRRHEFKNVEAWLSHHAHSHHGGSHDDASDSKAFLGLSPERLVRVMSKNEFVIALAVISFFATIVLTLLDYSFLSEVKGKYKTDKELAGFLGSFFSAGYVVIIVTKMLFTGRLIERFGVKGSLSILPIVLSTGFLSIVGIYFFNGSEQGLFIAVGISMLLAEVVKYSIQEPSFLALFQPLGREERLHGHGVVKSLSDPLAISVTGFILLVLTFGYEHFMLVLVPVLALVFLVGWWVYVFRADERYYSVIRRSLEKRFLGAKRLLFGEDVAMKFVQEKMESGRPEEVVFAFEWLRNSSNSIAPELLKKMLHSPEPAIRKAALSWLEKHPEPVLKDQVWGLSNSTDHEEARYAVVAWAGMTQGEEEEHALRFLNHDDLKLRLGAIEGFLRHSGLEGIIPAGQSLMAMIGSIDAGERKLAINLVGKLGQRNFYRPVQFAMKDPEPEVRLAAVEAAGLIRNTRLIPALIQSLKEPGLKTAAVNSLSEFGDLVFSEFNNLLKENEKENATFADDVLLRIAGRTGNISYLMAQFNHAKGWDRMRILEELRRAGYRGDAADLSFWKNEFLHLVNRAGKYAAFIAGLEGKKEFTGFREALRTEFNQLVHSCFLILSFNFDSKGLHSAREGWLLGEGRGSERLAHGLELLEKVLPAGFSSKMIPLLEPIPFSEKARLLNAAGIQNPLSVPSDILSEEHPESHIWTRIQAFIMLPRSRGDAPEKIDPEKVELTIKEDMRRHGHVSESLLSLVEKVLLLKATSLFAETPEQVLSEVASIVEEEAIHSGNKIFSKGDPGSCMYIISSGKIRIHDGDTELALLGSKDFFGEFSLLDAEPRSASATATEDAMLLRIDQEPFFDLMSERPEIMRGILRELCTRIRRQNIKLTGQVE